MPANKYYYLRFPKTEIEKMKEANFSYFLFRFKLVEVNNRQSFFILSGLPYKSDGSAIGNEFDLPKDPQDLQPETLTNQFRGIIKLEKEVMLYNGMDGTASWFLKPLRFSKQGPPTEYVTYLFSDQQFLEGGSLVPSASNFSPNPSPPASLDLS